MPNRWPFLTGWCGYDAREWQHQRCSGTCAGAICTCPCHRPAVVAHCFLACGHTTTGTDAQEVHDAMEIHYGQAHALAVGRLANA